MTKKIKAVRPPKTVKPIPSTKLDQVSGGKPDIPKRPGDGTTSCDEF